MADVSVEFGAKDVGLQESLKKIQDEMLALEGKVKSGELSFEELESTMKRLSQVERLEKQLQAIGNASADSSPKIKKLGDDIDSAGSRAQSVGGIFEAEFQKMAGAFTVGNLAALGFQKIVELAFGAARQVVQGFSDALDLGGRLNELSSRTGETAGKLLVLETAFKNSGLEAEQVGTAINKLQNFMQDAANGGEKQRAAMQSLGISMADLEGKTPTEEMQIFADRIAAIEDPTQRAALASEVFGDKLGGKLLPLFTDFSGNLDDAREKVGSLEQVMDENAATFDAAAETIEAVKGKMAAFAAGVLGETIPALEDLGKSMEQVDAAGLGKDVGEFLSPRLEKLSFVTIGTSEALKELIDLLTTAPSNTSTFGKAVNAVAVSLDGFNHYMQKAINFISPMDDLLTMLEQKGRDAAESQDTAAASIAGTGTAAQTAATELQNVGTASDTATGKVDALGTSAQSTGQNIASAFSLTSDFAPKLDEISGSWGGVNDQILGSKNLLSENLSLTDSMTGSIDEQSASFVGINENLDSILAAEKQSEESKKVSKDLADLIEKTYGKHAEKLAEIQSKQDALAAKETERKDKLSEALNFELAINEAKAAGDTELVKALENQKLFNAELQKAIDAGMGEPQAKAFAQQMVNAKNAAEAIGNRTAVVSVITKVDSAALDGLLVKLRVADNPKLIEVICKVTGSESLAEAEQKLLSIQNADAKKTVVFDALKTESWEETFDKLNGLPPVSSRQLAMSLTKTENFDQAVDQIWKLPDTKDVRLQLQAAGFESLDQFKTSLTDVATPREAKVICNTLGVADLQAAQQLISTIIAFNNAQTEIKVTADTKPAEAAIAATTAPKETTVTAKADTASAQTSLYELNQTPVTISADADINAASSRLASLAAAPFTISADADTTDAKNKVNMLGSAPLVFSLDGDTSDMQSNISTISSEPVTLSLNGDTTQAEQKIADLSTKTAKVPLDGDTTQLDQSVSEFTAKPITLSFDADTNAAAEKLKELEKPIVLQVDSTAIDQAIAEMQSDIANSFVGGTGGGGGAGGQGGQGGQGGDATIGTLSTIVETIKGILEKIEPKLPVPALT